MEPTRHGALDYIYIAQHVRSQGVLLQDCRKYEAEIEDLEKEGLTDQAKWYQHSILRVSERGKQKESARLRNRVEYNAVLLKRALDYIPPRIASFLINESVTRLREDELSYPVNLRAISQRLVAMPSGHPYRPWKRFKKHTGQDIRKFLPSHAPLAPQRDQHF